MRFRRGEFAIMTDVEQMFYCFGVFPAHRNFLRFLWHEDNDVNPLIIKVVICRHLTEGAIRAAGFWITSGKRLMFSVLRNGVSCKKLRRKEAIRKMADIPKDRLEPNPPFTND